MPHKMHTPHHRRRLAKLAKGLPLNQTLLRTAWLDIQSSRAWELWTRCTCPSRNQADRAYVVGPWKTGTTTIAETFATRGTAHEPEVWTVYRDLVAYSNHRISEHELMRRLRVRDRMLNLRIESNAVLGLLAPQLAKTFPNARFVLTVRDPVSWLESWINQAAFGSGHGVEPWESFRSLLFSKYPHESHDKLLQEKGLFSLRSYFSYWSEHYRTVLEGVERSRLFVVSIDDLDCAMPDLAKFLGFPEVRPVARSNARFTKPYRLQDLVDAKALQVVREEICSDIEEMLRNVQSLERA